MTISITKTLKAENHVTPEDVMVVKKALIRTGHYKIPEYGLTPYPDRLLFSAIKSYQKDAGLQVDGVIKPDGPTMRSLNITLNEEESEQGEDPGVRGPTIWCPQCGGPHGGSKGDLCPDCDIKK